MSKLEEAKKLFEYYDKHRSALEHGLGAATDEVRA
jgi:hypothetical protein